MASRVSNFTDLIQRVAASCLLHPLACRPESNDINENETGDEEDEDSQSENGKEEEEEEENEERLRVWEEAEEEEVRSRSVKELEMLMAEVFDAVSAMKRAYLSLQEAHSPWDPDKMRVADVAVVGELRRIGVLREKFRRRVRRGESGCGGKRVVVGATLREVVAPYEAAVEELKREVKVKEVEVENLTEKLRSIANLTAGGKKGRSQSKRRIRCSLSQVAVSPAPELFETSFNQVKETFKSFTSLLLSLMRSANWDIAAAVRSIEAATAATPPPPASNIGSHHAKYALESYISRKIFESFDHETFYMDGSLSSLINPDQFRRDCFTQFKDMKSMDPIELLGILPTCHFGKFCSKKYLSIIHEKMESSLLGDLEHRRQVLAGNHPRSKFYSEYLGVAKAIWLLHLLAFSVDPPPSLFEVSGGAEFHPLYMESVLRVGGGGRVAGGQNVGFLVTPGFKLGNGLIIKARVYLTPRT